MATMPSREATIRTAAVEIKALTVGGKQVTLSLFRQLQEEPVVTRLGAKVGMPWGFVNYHCDGCQDESEHLHLIWQKEDELRRCRFHASAWRSPFAGSWIKALWDRELELGGLKSFARAVELGQKPEMRRRGELSWDNFAPGGYFPAGTEFEIGFEVETETEVKEEIYATNPQRAEALFRLRQKFADPTARQEAAAAVNRVLRAAGHDLFNPELLDRALGEAIYLRSEFQYDWRECWREFQALDQLFIAV